MDGITLRLSLTAPSVYQEYLAKTLADKYHHLSMQMDKVINDANSEIEHLNQKLFRGSGSRTWFEWKC
jgi:hypothetical protein